MKASEAQLHVVKSTNATKKIQSPPPRYNNTGEKRRQTLRQPGSAALQQLPEWNYRSQPLLESPFMSIHVGFIYYSWQNKMTFDF